MACELAMGRTNLKGFLGHRWGITINRCARERMSPFTPVFWWNHSLLLTIGTVIEGFQVPQ